MTPTNELRFVERWDVEGELSHVLQQKWVENEVWNGYSDIAKSIEWRDVPLMEEKP